MIGRRGTLDPTGSGGIPGKILHVLTSDHLLSSLRRVSLLHSFVVHLHSFRRRVVHTVQRVETDVVVVLGIVCVVGRKVEAVLVRLLSRLEVRRLYVLVREVRARVSNRGHNRRIHVRLLAVTVLVCDSERRQFRHGIMGLVDKRLSAVTAAFKVRRSAGLAVLPRNWV